MARLLVMLSLGYIDHIFILPAQLLKLRPDKFRKWFDATQPLVRHDPAHDRSGGVDQSKQVEQDERFDHLSKKKKRIIRLQGGANKQED